MKKRIVLMLLAVAFAAAGNAQKREPWDIYVGPKAGANMSNLTNVDGTMKPGFMAGGWFETMVNEYLSLGMDLTYDLEGSKDAKYGLTDKIAVKKCDYTMGWINMEYMARCYFGNVFALAGIRHGILVHSKATADMESLQLADGYTLEDYNLETSRKLTNDLKKSTVTFPVGLGVELGPIQVEARWYAPLANIAKKATQEKFLKQSKPTMFVVTLGWKFQTM